MRWSSGLAKATTAFTLLFAAAAQGATVNPNSKDYGSQAVGTGSAAASFVLTTSGTLCTPDGMGGCSPSTLSNVDTSELGGGPGTNRTAGDFVIHNDDCTYPTLSSPSGILDGMSSCTFEASFMPVAAGARGLTLTFTDSFGPTASLALSGTGLAGPPAVPTGQREAAIKKCKKKFPKGSARRKRCLRHARQLPV